MVLALQQNDLHDEDSKRPVITYMGGQRHEEAKRQSNDGTLNIFKHTCIFGKRRQQQLQKWIAIYFSS